MRARDQTFLAPGVQTFVIVQGPGCVQLIIITLRLQLQRVMVRFIATWHLKGVCTNFTLAAEDGLAPVDARVRVTDLLFPAGASKSEWSKKIEFRGRYLNEVIFGYYDLFGRSGAITRR
jgi:hypothetical protein